MHRRLAALTAALVLLAVPAPAEARGGAKGVTNLEVTAPLGALGLSAVPLAPASASGATFSFPIVTPYGQGKKSGRVLHRGGIELSAGGKTLRLRNCLIRLDKGDLTAEVNGGPRVPIVTLEVPAGARLARGPVGPVVAKLTAAAAGALTQTFGAPDLTGAELGRATIVYGG